MTSPSLLLVDDDQPLRDRLANALRSRGFDVAAHSNAADALLATQSRAFWGAIVDMRMPGSDGLSLIRELRAQPHPPRIVVLTGFGSIANALEAVRLGALHYLTKPADVDSIVQALRGDLPLALDTHQTRDDIPSLGRVEWEHIQRVLTECGGNISQTARLLGINRRSLQRKLGKYPPAR